MAVQPLSDLYDWHLVHEDQDIRGWKVLDDRGTEIGRIDELLVDTDSEVVDRIRLDNGEEFSARDIEIEDGVVHVRGEAALTASTTEPLARTYRDTRIRQREVDETGATAGMTAEGEPLSTATSGTPLMPAGYDAYAGDFRSNFRSEYGDENWMDYEPAYIYGYTVGSSGKYAGRDYAEVEPELRTEYEREHGTGTWDRVRDAVSYAFHRGRDYNV
ncbi:MAG TPA: PRC-barrel domain-containing protein [Rhodothermales bacterium]|nr:PRC-barrel domain-containing protein [Rhodothermales bacterium]